MGVKAKGIPRGCQGLFTPVSLGYPYQFSIKTLLSTLKRVSYADQKPSEIAHERSVFQERVG